MARRHSGMVCHSWTLRNGHPFLLIPSSSSGSLLIRAGVSLAGAGRIKTEGPREYKVSNALANEIYLPKATKRVE